MLEKCLKNVLQKENIAKSGSKISIMIIVVIKEENWIYNVCLKKMSRI